VQNWFKTQPKYFFWLNLKTCETLELVRLSRGDYVGK
jgi:hypothetical protein